MKADIVYNGKKYFLKLNYPGPNHFKFEVLEFSNLDQIKELKSKLIIAIASFEQNVKPIKIEWDQKQAENKLIESYDVPHNDDFVGYTEG